MPITLQEVMKLAGIEDWTLTPSQQKYLIESTNHALERYSPEELLKMRALSRKQLAFVFNEL